MRISEFPQEKLSEPERLFCTLYWQIGFSLDLPEPLCQYRAIPGRKFISDFAFLGGVVPILIECDGGAYFGRRGGHTGKKGFERDREKDLLALEQGYLTVRITPDMLKNAPELIFKVLASLYSEGL